MHALTMDSAYEHIARVQEVMKLYYIEDFRRVFNVDITGIFFKSICSCRLRKDIGRVTKPLYNTEVSTKKNLDPVTTMGAVNAAEIAYKPVIVFPGVQAHQR